MDMKMDKNISQLILSNHSRWAVDAHAFISYIDSHYDNSTSTPLSPPST